MRHAGRLFALAVAVTLSSCDWMEYQVELTPRGNQIERKITATFHSGNQGTTASMPAKDGQAVGPAHEEPSEKKPPATMPAEEAEALSKAYGQKPPQEPGAELTLSGTFSGTLPQDIGGSSSYSYFQTDMGKAYMYLERFRGNDDLRGQVQQRDQAVDQVVDVLIAWMQTKMKDGPRWDKLRTFMDGPLRKDLKNLATYVWTSSLAWGNPRWWTQEQPPPVEGGTVSETAARFYQYLVDRGVLKRDDVPTITRAVTVTFADRGWDDTLAFLQRLAARQMGVADDQPIPPSLAFLGDAKGVADSLREFLPTTKQYQQALEEWKKQQPGPDASQPDPMDVLLSRPVAQMLQFDPIGANTTADRLKVSLATGTQPAATNGFYDEQTGKVNWSGAIPRRDVGGDGLPPFCYAAWAQADEEFQKRHFGIVALKADELLTYCLWREGLTGKQAKEWDAFVASLRPGPGLAEKLEEFRFSDELAATRPGQEHVPASYAATITQEILGSLQAATQPTQPASQPATRAR